MLPIANKQGMLSNAFPFVNFKAPTLISLRIITTTVHHGIAINSIMFINHET